MFLTAIATEILSVSPFFFFGLQNHESREKKQGQQELLCQFLFIITHP